MKAAISRMLAFAARNERHLGAVAFILGFGVDLFTFTVLSVAYANLAFASYLCLALSMVLLGSVFPRLRTYEHSWARTVSVLAPLAAQYAIGSLLSGFMIFYAKSAELSAAWPFLLLLAGAFIGNEFFRTHYKYLAFQLSLLFFALYAYLIFAIPLLLEKLGPLVFLMSTGASVVGFALYLYLLGRINKVELYASLRFALPGALVTLLLINVAYFTGALPPIPLTMPESGIYHALEKVDGKYVVQSEKALKWYEFYIPRTLHTGGTTALYAYSAVAAPIKFGARVAHRWEHYDESKNAWVTESRIEFAISGGRPGGYRGYSEFTPHTAGAWRVSVETSGGQVIGRVPFTLVVSDMPPVLHEETH
jgi:MFS family permease